VVTPFTLKSSATAMVLPAFEFPVVGSIGPCGDRARAAERADAAVIVSVLTLDQMPVKRRLPLP